MKKTIADLTLIETKGDYLKGNLNFRTVIDKKPIDSKKIILLKYPAISFGIEGIFMRIEGHSFQKGRLIKMISEKYKKIPAPEGADALLLSEAYGHWKEEEKLTYTGIFCVIKEGK